MSEAETRAGLQKDQKYLCPCCSSAWLLLVFSPVLCRRGGFPKGLCYSTEPANTSWVTPERQNEEFERKHWLPRAAGSRGWAHAETRPVKTQTEVIPEVTISELHALATSGRSSQSYSLADVSSRVGIFIANIPNKVPIWYTKPGTLLTEKPAWRPYSSPCNITRVQRHYKWIKLCKASLHFFSPAIIWIVYFLR